MTEQPSADIRFLYHSNYWDGPLSGACLYQRQQYWFECVHDYHDPRDNASPRLGQRIFGIYQISEDEWAQEKYWQDLFEQNVGSHSSYDETGQRLGKVASPETHHIFYDAQEKAQKDGTYKRRKKLTEPLGYFDRAEMKFRTTKFREYWLSDESTPSIHQTRCENYDLVVWRNDAEDWSEGDFDGGTAGWAICRAEDKNDTTSHWLIVKYCPWCGAPLK